MASNLEAVTPQWTWQIAQPLFEGDVDLVLPHYARCKFEVLLNVGIIAPMVRALYGKRVNNPMGPDFSGFRAGCSKESLPQAAGPPAAIALIR